MWIGVLVVFLAGTSFVAYKLYMRQKTRAEAQRWEMTSVMKINRELSSDELERYLLVENEKLDRYEVLRPIVDELDLVTFWNLSSVDEALEKLKASAELRPGDEPGTIVFVASDKDKEMTGKLGEAIGKAYKAALLQEQLRMPTPPPGFQD